MPSKFSNKQLFDESTLKMFGKDYVKILTIMLKRAGKKASGALINSLDYRLKKDAKQILIILEANDYLEYVDQGRKPGSYPPIREIAKWTTLKGIPKSAAFAISRNIFKFGIKPTNVIADTLKEITTSPTLRNKYEKAMVDNVEDYIFKNFKNNM